MSKLKITLFKSLIGQDRKFRKIAESLGLGKLNSSVIQENNASTMGKVKKISHLLTIEEVK